VADTYGGQSGSPVFIKDGGAFVAVGIHAYGGAETNACTRIVPEVADKSRPLEQRALARPHERRTSHGIEARDDEADPCHGSLPYRTALRLLPRVDGPAARRMRGRGHAPPPCQRSSFHQELHQAPRLPDRRGLRSQQRYRKGLQTAAELHERR
jgi:hypothetical protein